MQRLDMDNLRREDTTLVARDIASRLSKLVLLAAKESSLAFLQYLLEMARTEALALANFNFVQINGHPEFGRDRDY